MVCYGEEYERGDGPADRDFKGGVPEMKLIFEKSVEGRGADILPQETICQVNFDGQVRSCAPKLPQVSEQQVSRHYSELSKRAYG